MGHPPLFWALPHFRVSLPILDPSPPPFWGPPYPGQQRLPGSDPVEQPQRPHGAVQAALQTVVQSEQPLLLLGAAVRNNAVRAGGGNGVRGGWSWDHGGLWGQGGHGGVTSNGGSWGHGVRGDLGSWEGCGVRGSHGRVGGHGVGGVGPWGHGVMRGLWGQKESWGHGRVMGSGGLWAARTRVAVGGPWGGMGAWGDYGVKRDHGVMGELWESMGSEHGVIGVMGAIGGHGGV